MATLVLVSVALAAVTVAERPAVVVTDAETGERLAVLPVMSGDAVTLSYLHSVERSPVTETYAVRGGQLVLTRMTFQSYGWGLPAEADIETVDGVFVAHPEWAGDELVVAPGPIAEHRLRVGDRSIDLVGLAGGGSVRIAVDRRAAVWLALDVLRSP